MLKLQFNKYYCVSLVAVLLAKLQFSFLPECEICILILSYFYNRRAFYYLFIIVFASNTFVVMDVLYRFDSGTFPSIYTKEMIGGIKYLDVLSVVLFLLGLLNVRNIRKVHSVSLPYLLIFSSLIGLTFIEYSQQFSLEMFLFIGRGYLLCLAAFMLLVGLDKDVYMKYCKLAIITWILNMIFAIVIPYAHPHTREIFGITLSIAFAGDEYLTLGVYGLILLLYSSEYDIKDNYRFVKYSFITALLCGIASQRKGAVPYFMVLMLIIYVYYNCNSIKNKIMNILLIASSVYIALFLLIVYDFLPDYIQLAFFEYHGLLDSALSSVDYLKNYNWGEYLFGISPWGKYKVIDLPQIIDHEYSFGKEVGEVFRYSIWVIPGGRLVLNTGILGLIYYYCFIIRKAIEYKNCMYYYLLITITPLFYYASITPVEAISFGLILAVMFNKKSSIVKNANISVNNR